MHPSALYNPWDCLLWSVVGTEGRPKVADGGNVRNVAWMWCGGGWPLDEINASCLLPLLHLAQVKTGVTQSVTDRLSRFIHLHHLKLDLLRLLHLVQVKTGVTQSGPDPLTRFTTTTTPNAQVRPQEVHAGQWFKVGLHTPTILGGNSYLSWFYDRGAIKDPAHTGTSKGLSQAIHRGPIRKFLPKYANVYVTIQSQLHSAGARTHYAAVNEVRKGLCWYLTSLVHGSALNGCTDPLSR